MTLMTQQETLEFYRNAYTATLARAESLEKSNTILYEREALHTEESGILNAEIRKLKDSLSEAVTWTDEDKVLPEDGAIHAAHPLKSDDHKTYGEAHTSSVHYAGEHDRLLVEALTALKHVYRSLGCPEGMRPLITKIEDAALSMVAAQREASTALSKNTTNPNPSGHATAEASELASEASGPVGLGPHGSSHKADAPIVATATAPLGVGNAQGCGYEGFHFGAIYPDGGCHGSYLHDLDADGFDPDDITHPCPNCNAGEFFERAVETSCDTTEAGARAWAAKVLGACLTYHLMDGDAKDVFIRARRDGTAKPLIEFHSQGNQP